MNIQCLIIDRNPIYSEQLGRYIESFRDDFRVHHALDAEAGIEALVSTDFSLVLCEPFLANAKTGLVSWITDHMPDMPLIITGQEDTPITEDLDQHSCVKGFVSRPMVRAADLAGKVVIALSSLFFQGNLRGVNCITLFQIFEQECDECTLRVLNKSKDEEGLLFVKAGVLLDAVYASLAPEEAVRRILSWESVDIELYDFCPLKDKSVNADMTALILQCADKQGTAKQTTSEPAPPVSGKDGASKTAPKPVGGLAGLFLKRAKKK